MKIGDTILKSAPVTEHIVFSQEVNNNGFAIADKGEYYEVVENETPQPQPQEATWQDKIEAQVMYTALMTDSLLDESEGE